MIIKSGEKNNQRSCKTLIINPVFVKPIKGIMVRKRKESQDTSEIEAKKFPSTTTIL
jgi:hypothetical protein